MVRHLVAASMGIVLLVSGCSDDGSDSSDGADGTAATAPDDAADETIPRLSIDLDELAAQLEAGEVEVPPDYEAPPPRQIDAACLGSVLNHLVREGAIEEGDLMLWYSGAEEESTGPINDATAAIFAAGDCLKN